jgi:hypothetical protein
VEGRLNISQKLLEDQSKIHEFRSTSKSHYSSYFLNYPQFYADSKIFWRNCNRSHCVAVGNQPISERFLLRDDSFSNTIETYIPSKP